MSGIIGTWQVAVTLTFEYQGVSKEQAEAAGLSALTVAVVHASNLRTARVEATPGGGVQPVAGGLALTGKSPKGRGGRD